jgi:hypothetical protein
MIWMPSIPLNAEGDTLDSLYHWAYEPEIETAMRRWLVSTIQRLESNVLSRIRIHDAYA